MKEEIQGIKDERQSCRRSATSTGTLDSYATKTRSDVYFDRFDRAAMLQPGRRSASIINRRSFQIGDRCKIQRKKLYTSYFKIKTFFQSVIFPGISRSLLAVITSCVITAVIVEVIDKNNYWIDKFQKSQKSIATLGTFVTFSLVFRTDSCYSRWWEARSCWGKLASSISHVARQGSTWIQDPELRDRFVAYSITFPFACKAVVRGNNLKHADEEGKIFVEQGLLTSNELDEINNSGNCCAQTCVDMLWSIINCAIASPQGLTPSACEIRSVVIKRMELCIGELNATVWSLKRLKTTRMPITYNYFVKFTILIFVISSNLAWAPNLGWYTPIVTFVIIFVINTFVNIGDRMLDSFGIHLVGLPLQKYCTNIELEVIDIYTRNTIFPGIMTRHNA